MKITLKVKKVPHRLQTVKVTQLQYIKITLKVKKVPHRLQTVKVTQLQYIKITLKVKTATHRIIEVPHQPFTRTNLSKSLQCCIDCCGIPHGLKVYQAIRIVE